jgi:hypothetical protein
MEVVLDIARISVMIDKDNMDRVRGHQIHLRCLVEAVKNITKLF